MHWGFRLNCVSQKVIESDRIRRRLFIIIVTIGGQHIHLYDGLFYLVD